MCLIKRRGGKRRRASRDIRARLRRILQHEYSVTAEHKNDGNQENPQHDAAALKVARSKAFAGQNLWARATRALEQDELISPSTEVLEKLKPLHPTESGKAPALPPGSPEHVEVDLDTLSKIITTRLKNGSAPGPSGWTGELIAPLTSDRECLTGLARLIEDILNGNLDPNSRSLILSSLLIPAPKSGNGVRPIAISESLYKLATMYGMNLVKDELPAIFEPIQFACGAKGGTERAIHLLQAALECMGPETVLLKCDIRNAFNEVKRSVVLGELFKHDSLKPIWRIAHWAYDSPSALLMLDRGIFVGELSSASGVKQGDCLASLLFSLAIQPLLKESIKDLPNLHIAAVADDVSWVGESKSVFTAFDRFTNALESTGLVVRAQKCGLLTLHPNPSPPILAFLQQKGIPHHVGTMEMLGTVVGIGDKSIETRIQKQKPLLLMLLRDDLPAQIAVLLIRLCIIPRMIFLLRVMPPHLMASHAATFDNMIMSVVAHKLNLSPLPDAAKFTLSMPIRFGGFGLRLMGSTAHVAYYCSLALSAPDIARIIPYDRRREMLLRPETQTRFAKAISEAHAHIQRSEIEAKVIPASVEQFWLEFGKQVRECKGLQKIISAHLEQKASELFLRSLPLKDRQRMLSASAQFAGAWKTATPSTPEQTLSDEDFRIAVKIGLGLPLDNNLPDKCECGASLREQPLHFLWCKLLTRPAMSTRHDWLVHLLAVFFRAVGAVVHIEPRVFDYNRVRPDLQIYSSQFSLQIDVTVVAPNSPSRESEVRLAAAHSAEARKTWYYTKNANLLGNGKLLAFAVETYGGFGKEAQEIINVIQKSSRSSVETQIRSLAVTLQRGNAHVVKEGAIRARVAALHLD